MTRPDVPDRSILNLGLTMGWLEGLEQAPTWGYGNDRFPV